LRVLALAVSALLLIDPLLVEAIGFRLSVAASAGIVLLATPIAARLPLPRVLAETAGVTLAAQVAVAPIVLTTFGGLPVASLPANILVSPVPGPLMVWGATGGVVAGAIGGPVATLLHLPTRLMLGWVQLVGRVAGRVPLGELHARHLLVAVPAAAVLLFARAAPRRWLRPAAGVVLAGALLAPAVGLHTHRATGRTITPGVQLWRDGAHAIVVVDGRADPVRALEGMRRAGVRRIDVAIARTGAVGVGDVLRALDGRYPIGATWAPIDHAIRGATVPDNGAIVRAGPFELLVQSVDPRLDVRVEVMG
jgi:competence protein ComEC